MNSAVRIALISLATALVAGMATAFAIDLYVDHVTSSTMDLVAFVRVMNIDRNSNGFAIDFAVMTGILAAVYQCFMLTIDNE